MNLPWPEAVTVFSMDPDAAGRDDVARLAAELMQARQLLVRIQKIATDPAFQSDAMGWIATECRKVTGQP